MNKVLFSSPTAYNLLDKDVKPGAVRARGTVETYPVAMKLYVVFAAVMMCGWPNPSAVLASVFWAALTVVLLSFLIAVFWRAKARVYKLLGQFRFGQAVLKVALYKPLPLMSIGDMARPASVQAADCPQPLPLRV